MSRKGSDVLMQAQAQVIAAAGRLDVLEAAGLRLPPILEQMPARLPVLTLRDNEADLLFRLADRSILDLEVQTHPATERDVERWLHYSCLLLRRYHVPVHTVVVYGRGVESAPDAASWGSPSMRIWNCYLGTRDAFQVLQALEEEAARHGELSGPAIALLGLSGLMGPSGHDPVEAAARAARLAEAVPDPQLREVTRAAIFGFAARGLSGDDFERLKEAMRVASSRLADAFVAEGLAKGRAEGRAEGKAEGKAEGRAEGKAEALLTVLRVRFGTVPDDVARRIETENDTERLQTWLEAAAAASALVAWRREAGL